MRTKKLAKMLSEDGYVLTVTDKGFGWTKAVTVDGYRQIPTEPNSEQPTYVKKVGWAWDVQKGKYLPVVEGESQRFQKDRAVFHGGVSGSWEDFFSHVRGRPDMDRYGAVGLGE